jgi:hypothetical protein
MNLGALHVHQDGQVDGILLQVHVQGHGLVHGDVHLVGNVSGRGHLDLVSAGGDLGDVALDHAAVHEDLRELHVHQDGQVDQVLLQVHIQGHRLVHVDIDLVGRKAVRDDLDLVRAGSDLGDVAPDHAAVHEDLRALHVHEDCQVEEVLLEVDVQGHGLVYLHALLVGGVAGRSHLHLMGAGEHRRRIALDGPAVNGEGEHRHVDVHGQGKEIGFEVDVQDVVALYAHRA